MLSVTNFTDEINETERLQELDYYQILDTAPETIFDQLVQLAANLFKMPIAHISFVTRTQVWYKASYGLKVIAIGRSQALVAKVLDLDDMLVVENTTCYPAFANNPFVTGSPFFRFYAGAPIRSPKGYVIGVFSLLDYQPHTLSAEEQDQLAQLATQVMEQLKLRLDALKYTNSQATLAALYASKLQSFILIAPDFKIQALSQGASTSLKKIGGHEPKLGEDMHNFVFPHDIDGFRQNVNKALQGEATRLEKAVPSLNGMNDWIEVTYEPLFDNEAVINGVYVTSTDITKRKQAEFALKKSEAKLQTIFENTLQAFILIDSNYKIQAFNWLASQQAKAAFGRELQEGDYFYDFVQPYALQDFNYNFQRALNGVTVSVERSITTIEGKQHWFEFKYNPVYNHEKQVTSVYLTVQDFTERRQASNALKESEERFRLAFEHAPNGMALADLNGNFTWANPVYCEMLGYSLEELLKYNFLDITHPADLALNVQFSQQLVHNAIPRYQMEKRYLHKEGHIVHVIVQVTVIRDVQGQPLYQLGQVVDITRRVKAEEALRASEDTYRQLFEGNPLPMWVYDLETLEFSAVNQAAIDHYGYSRQEFLAMTINDVHPAEDAKALLVSLNTVKADVKSSSIWKHHKKDGTLIDVEISSHRLLNQQKPAQLVIAHDITERQKATEEFLKASKLEALGLLAGGIAHDFNNILTVIVGNLTLARSQIEQDKQLSMNLHPTLVEAETASIRARDLTQQLLTFAKGGAPVKQTALLPQIVEESARFGVHGSNVQPEFNLPDNLWPVEVDRGQLSQVIQNLLINAVQAMPLGGKVFVQAKNIKLGEGVQPPLVAGDYVCISVKDHGMGISSEHMGRIFDPYFTTKEKGSGLGLTTSYSIVRQHGGLISVETKPGQGSTFNVFLPAHINGGVQPARVEQPPRQLLGHGRILVMDDEAMLRTMLKRILERLGYEVELTNDGEAAIECYQLALTAGQPFAAVIMDLTVPGGMGGKEAVSKLLEIDPQAQVIVSSGYSEDPVMANFQEYGFAGVVAKPYLIEELVGVVQKVIKT